MRPKPMNAIFMKSPCLVMTSRYPNRNSAKQPVKQTVRRSARTCQASGVAVNADQKVTRVLNQSA